MQDHAVVLERASGAWTGKEEVPGDFLEGFLLGHRAAEVDNVKKCPEGKDLVAYDLGYSYASRLTVRYADPTSRKRTK